MKFKAKKIIVILSICVLIGSTTVVVASARPSWLNILLNGTEFEDLVNKWNEIREAKAELHDMLESYGVDLPDLTDQQKWIIWETIWQLIKEGATKEEIRSEIISLLEDFGVEFPNLSEEDKKEIRQWIKNILETDYGFVFPELLEEEKKEIKQFIIELKKQGATREEIWQQVKKLLETDYGFVFPELSENEKEEIRDKIKNLLENEYDLDLPDLTLEQREAVKNKRNEIRQLQKELHEMLKNADRLTKIRFYRYVKNTMNPPKIKNIMIGSGNRLFTFIKSVLNKISNLN
jgi:hypothetical protein